MLATIDLQILQSKLHHASCSAHLFTKQNALIEYNTKTSTLKAIHEETFKAVANKHGVYATNQMVNVFDLTEFEINLHLETALAITNSEIQKRSYDLGKYRKAEAILFAPEQKFSKDQILYSNKNNQTLSVEKLLKVSKYAIAYAETMNPNDRNIELASAAITVFQSIELALNNQNQTISASKKLHLANAFLAIVVKANIKDTDTKRGITIASTLIDLAIDFFSGN